MILYAKETSKDAHYFFEGTSSSSYEEVVNPFYGFWQSYSTKRAFYSMDKWDLREAENRRTSRAMVILIFFYSKLFTVVKY